MVAVAKRAAPTPSTWRSIYRPAIPRRTHDDAPRAAAGDVFGVDERTHLQDRLAAAEARANAAEESFRTVQEQLKQTLARIGELEGRLAMEEETRAAREREIAALRTQITESAESLHKAEIDNNAMRERMALRQQELDEARRQLGLAHPSDAEVEDIRMRLETAEQAAAALERELARVEAELDRTKSSFHLTKLTEALRELDEEEGEGVGVAIDEEEDDLYEHPVVIRNGSRLGKVR
jgi:chromosome segregation ATPase